MGYVTDAVVKKDINQLKKLHREKGVEEIKEAKDLRKNNILHLSCENGTAISVRRELTTPFSTLEDPNIIDFALGIGIDWNAQNVAGDTPLIISSRKGDLETVKKLCDAGCKVNHVNNHGNTALHYACFWRRAEIALYLTKTAGAYVNISNHYNALPCDHTSRMLMDALKAVAKQQGDQIIRAVSLEDVITSPLLKNDTAINDWTISAEDVEIGDQISKSCASLPPASTNDNPSTTFKGIYNSMAVAIKVIPIEFDPSDAELGLIRKEISAIRKVQSPNLVSILGVCTEAPDICYITAFETGGNLESLLMNTKIWISPQEATNYTLQICKAIITLHESKPEFIVHGNLKPSNILIKKDGKLALCDFGFSQSIFHPLSSNPQTLSCGVEWWAPELLRGDDNVLNDLRPSDIYNFGLVLYSVMTRQPLYPIANPMVLGYLVASQGLVPTVPDFIPPILIEIMAKCWNQNRDERPIARHIYQDLLKLKF